MPPSETLSPKKYMDLLGKPWEANARGPDKFDCWGVCIEYYKRLGIALPDKPGICTPRPLDMVRFAVEQVGGGHWKPSASTMPELHAVALMGRRDRLFHAGVHVGGQYILHCPSAGEVCVQSIYQLVSFGFPSIRFYVYDNCNSTKVST